MNVPGLDKSAPEKSYNISLPSSDEEDAAKDVRKDNLNAHIDLDKISVSTVSSDEEDVSYSN